MKIKPKLIVCLLSLALLFGIISATGGSAAKNQGKGAGNSREKETSFSSLPTLTYLNCGSRGFLLLSGDYPLRGVRTLSHPYPTSLVPKMFKVVCNVFL
ncbi:MAG: hypothetical protein NC293_05980 [Roseburia sp.]|nr:hypothetical protein [Roseburia sp.]